MSATWWLITGAAAFGWAVTVLPLLRHLTRQNITDICHPPAAALTVQALVLWAAGTAVLGAVLSFAAGLAAMAAVAKFQNWRHG